MRERNELENKFNQTFDEYKLYLEDEMIAKIEKLQNEVRNEIQHKSNIENKNEKNEIRVELENEFK